MHSQESKRSITRLLYHATRGKTTFQNGVGQRGSSVLNSAEPSSWASTKYSLVSDLNGIGDLRKSLSSRIMGFTEVEVA